MAWQAVSFCGNNGSCNQHTSGVCWQTVCMHRRQTWLQANEVPRVQGHKALVHSPGHNAQQLVLSVGSLGSQRCLGGISNAGM